MIFKNLTFDGISLKEYGVYISGEAVFDSPTREVEMITIPGRNGSFALDKGRFNNITVTYPAGIYATSQTEFAEKVSTLRNLLASRKGYCRLTDEYNPDEFRLGVYKAGLELDPTHYNEAGRFELSFDCKPQRFLFSGEEVFTLGEWGQTETKSGSIASFEGDETTAIKSLTAQIVPKQSGSGDPSPDNVRPISGWDSVDVEVAGKNLLDPAYRYNTSASGNYHIRYYWNGGSATYNEKLLCKAGVTYTFSYAGTNASGIYIKKSTTQNITVKYNANTVTFTPTEDSWLSIDVYWANEPSGGVASINPILSVGSTATAYEPYQGTSYPISLGQTVYGGTLDVVSGELGNLWTTVDLGSLTWSGSNGVFYCTFNDAYVVANDYNFVAEAVCSAFKVMTRQALYTSTNDLAFSIHKTDRTYLTVRYNAQTSASAFKTAVSGVTLAYRQATSSEVTLTPTEVNTLLGQNNIWADSGDVTVEIGQNPNVLVNPTLFEACPLIEFNSSGEDGEINLGSKQIKVLSAILGRVNLGLDVSGSKTTTRTWQDVITVQNAGSFNAGDTLRFNGGKVIFTFNFTPINVEVVSQGTDLKASWQRGSNNLELSLNNLEFPAGTDTTYQFTCDIKVKASQTPSIEGTETFTVTTSYSRNGVLTITWAGGNYSFGEYTYIQGASNYTGYGDSTKNSLEDVDIYVDLDIGEAYSVDSSDNVVSLNNFVNLGGELPALDPGATEISTDDSISNVKVTPRWWKV